MIEGSGNPLKMLNEEQSKILKIIGETNGECIKIFKYIVSSKNSTPINANQSNTKTQHTFTPST